MSIRRAASWPQPRQAELGARAAPDGARPGSGGRPASVIDAAGRASAGPTPRRRVPSRSWASSPCAAGRASSRPSASASSPARPRRSSSRTLMASIEAIFQDVAERGDAAVLDATAEFDGIDLAASRPARARGGASRPPTPRSSRGSSPASARRSPTAACSTRPRSPRRPTSWRREVRPGFLVGEQFAAIPSVGLFVPTGKASYPSVLCQIGTPAVVAGRPPDRRARPADPGRRRRPSIRPPSPSPTSWGSREVYRANGPAGIAALTFGTATIPRVRKIVGPGSPAVTAAQVLAQRYGVATQMLCGPSESLIIADETADPWRLALDLLNEAEHGVDSAATLITTSEALDRRGRDGRRRPAAAPAGGACGGRASRPRRPRRGDPGRLDDARRSRSPTRTPPSTSSSRRRTRSGRWPGCATPVRRSSARTRRSAPRATRSASRPRCRPAATPSSTAASPPGRS